MGAFISGKILTDRFQWNERATRDLPTSARLLSTAPCSRAIQCYYRLVPDGCDHHGWPGAERASDAGVARQRRRAQEQVRMHAVAGGDPGRRRSRVAPIRQEQTARRGGTRMREPHGPDDVGGGDHRVVAQRDRRTQRRPARQRDPAAVADSRFGRSLPPVRRDRAREGSRRRRLGERRRILSRSNGDASSHALRAAC